MTYDVEQLYRDNRVQSIHEGTHGLQGLDLLGRKVPMKDGAGLKLLCDRIASTIAAAEVAGDRCRVFAAHLSEAVGSLTRATDAALSVAPDRGLDNSSAYLEATGHIVVAWLWLDQVLALGDRGDAFAAGKRQTALYFFEWELPKALTQLALVERLDSIPRDMLDAWF
ncbi:hypothetical protein GCM10023094_03530 [Rhodococcus olei]|uniref:Acetyl-CoA dehydrogenase-like C-terminal domain-containing protein n=1 Tax=Rhodococcus olei TaxID=2161675 RepID=A0ABP8NV22_9NOCA